MRLANKVAIITGGGSGIGESASYLFAREGAKVVIAQRTVDSGEKTANNIKSIGGEAIFVRTDVSVASETIGLVKTTINTFGRVDILYNNAAVIHKITEIENIEEVEWDYIYSINVKGAFLPIKYVVPEMKRAGGGTIINTGSMCVVQARPFLSDYSSSKGAIVTLTKALAIELAPFNIRVNCINPVITDTPAIRKAAIGRDGWEKYQKFQTSTIPLGSFAEPKDIANAAVFLASDESRMITGISLNVNGGRGI